ncbi:MAG: hypothetical protein EA405_09695 [Rhodospirillales bacterium]|nr:MAG: hypothetical protein EA405_09695 [Rhodospirillales bacterium]
MFRNLASEAVHDRVTASGFHDWDVPRAAAAASPGAVLAALAKERSVDRFDRTGPFICSY